MNDMNNSSVPRNKFIMSGFFWFTLIVTIVGTSLSEVTPILGLLGTLGIFAFLFAVVMEVYSIAKELDEAGIPKNQQRSWWVISGWWCLLMGDPLINGVFNFFFIAGLILLLIELKNISEFGVYLWVRRSFLSFIVGFAIPLAIIIIVLDIYKSVSSGKKRR